MSRGFSPDRLKRAAKIRYQFREFIERVVNLSGVLHFGWQTNYLVFLHCCSQRWDDIYDGFKLNFGKMGRQNCGLLAPDESPKTFLNCPNVKVPIKSSQWKRCWKRGPTELFKNVVPKLFWWENVLERFYLRCLRKMSLKKVSTKKSLQTGLVEYVQMAWLAGFLWKLLIGKTFHKLSQRVLVLLKRSQMSFRKRSRHNVPKNGVIKGDWIYDKVEKMLAKVF